MTRRTKASRREAFRRSFRRVMMSAAMAPIEGRPGPWDETRTAEWTAALDAVDALLRGAPPAVIAGEPLGAGQLVTLGADGRAYRAVR